MGLYARHVFPRLMERAIGSEEQLRERREALAPARGDVLEVGFGTGLNLSSYPPGVAAVTGVDPHRVLEKRVRRRIAEAPFPVWRVAADPGAGLPFPDAAFDTAVTTWTLCTIPEVAAALGEVRRVLRPDGRLLFLEHGRSESPRVARWQDRLTPVQRVVGCGCNLNRPIDHLIREAGFELERLDRFRMPGHPRLVGRAYRGIARPAPGGTGPAT